MTTNAMKPETILDSKSEVKTVSLKRISAKKKKIIEMLFAEPKKVTAQKYSIEAIYQMVKNGSIYIPDYQRYKVWTMRNCQELIESILFFGMSEGIFPFVIYDTTKEGKEGYELIDGKQRLSTIVGFIDNEFPLYYDGISIYFRDFTNVQQKYFLSRCGLIAYEYVSEMTYDERKSIYERLQRGEKHTAAELRHAFGGVFSDWISKTMEMPFFKEISKTSSKRMKDKDILTTCSYMEVEISEKGATKLPDAFEKQLNNFVKTYSLELPEKKLLDRTIAIFNYMYTALKKYDIKLTHSQIKQLYFTIRMNWDTETEKCKIIANEFGKRYINKIVNDETNSAQLYQLGRISWWKNREEIHNVLEGILFPEKNESRLAGIKLHIPWKELESGK